MSALLIAAADMALVLAAGLVVLRLDRRPTSYTRDHAAAGPLLDRTEGLL